MSQIKLKRAKEIIEELQGKSIAVVGDVMLDRFFWGSVSRVSPEAPVPVVDLEEETYHLGGAANVAANIRSLGANATLCGVIGEDNSGAAFVKITKEMGISPAGLFVDINRPTTVKTRIIGNNQHITRLDREVKTNISKECEDFIISKLESEENLSGIIFADYDKGAISEGLINKISEMAHRKNIPIYVDPKFKNFFHYKNTFLFKPNRKEASQSIDINIKSKEDVLKAGQLLIEKLQCENLLLTLGQDGMMLFEKSGEVFAVPTHARNVADVSGAGDTAIATLAAAVTGGASIKEAALLANIAAGAVCEQPGTVSITKEDIFKSISINYGE